MGNIGSTLSDTFHALSGEVNKLFVCIGVAPKTPLVMPNLGDGRTSDELRTAAEMMYNMDTKQCVNIAFVGPNSQDKTEFINALRFTADGRPDTAEFSPNSSAVQYTHCDPKYKHVRFWDVGDSEGTYGGRCLYAFDAVVLITPIPATLRPSDIELIREGCHYNPPHGVLIVRTGMNYFIDKEFGANPSTKDVLDAKSQQGQAIRESIRNQLLKMGVQCESQTHAVYLCSAPGMLAARSVNSDGSKYIWDDYGFMKDVLDSIGKRRY